MSAFPRLERIEDVLPVVEGRKEFVVVPKDGYTVIDYIYVDGQSFGCPVTHPDAYPDGVLRRECRGLKFDADGRLIGRAYHKFFNLGEKPEVFPDALEWSAGPVVLEKLDGSMVHAAELDGRIAFMTRRGITPPAERARAFAAAHPQRDYLGFCRAMLAEGLVPIFEWCAPADRIVIAHETEDLILTAVRGLRDGAYAVYAELAAAAARWGLPVVETHGDGVPDIAALTSDIRALTESEGRVIRFPDGRMVKIKADVYVSKHRLLSSIGMERNVVALALAGGIDDALPLVSADLGRVLLDFGAEVAAGVAAKTDALAAYVAQAKAIHGGDRKAFALQVQAELPKIEQSIAFAIWLGDAPEAAMAKVMEKHLNRENRLDFVRDFWGGARWADRLGDMAPDVEDE